MKSIVGTTCLLNMNLLDLVLVALHFVGLDGRSEASADRDAALHRKKKVRHHDGEGEKVHVLERQLRLRVDENLAKPELMPKLGS